MSGKKKKIVVQRVTDYDVSEDERDALKRALLKIVGPRVTGEVKVQLGQGGVSNVQLVEREG